MTAPKPPLVTCQLCNGGLPHPFHENMRPGLATRAPQPLPGAAQPAPNFLASVKRAVLKLRNARSMDDVGEAEEMLSDALATTEAMSRCDAYRQIPCACPAAPVAVPAPPRCECVMDIGDNYACPLHGMCAYEIEKAGGGFPSLCGRLKGHVGKHAPEWEIKFRRELAENPDKWDEFHRLLKEAEKETK